MTGASDIFVTLDDRVRLVSAVLAATPYPTQAQARRPHGTHAHARATRKQVSALGEHPAARMLAGLIDGGASLETIFALALDDNAARPDGWDTYLSDFYAQAALDEWWVREADWMKSVSDVSELFNGVALQPFLEPYLGAIDERLVFMPNIGYPTDHELALRIGGDLVLIVPPRLAWGDSPPWPYDEDPAHVYRAALSGYGRLLLTEYLQDHADVVEQAAQKPLPVSEEFKALHPSWEDQFSSLFIAGLVAIYLEDRVSPAEASSYVLMERKLHGLNVLPGVINIFRRYVGEKKGGHYNGLVDVLPHFAKQLKVANRLVSL
jgi:hypothetical protein